MKALLLYAAFVIAGGFVAFFVGLFVEREAGETLSLIVFLAMFFLNFVVSWIGVIFAMDGSLKNAQGQVEQREIERNYRRIGSNA